MQTSPATLSPPLKWAGGKRWLVPTLLPIWQKQSHRRLVEPFVGGMAVALGLRPKSALLNDLNFHLINFYRYIQQGMGIEIPLENNSDWYYFCRDQFNRLIRDGCAHSQEAAELFYYLNRTGYNGLCRFNNSNQFNVPFGRYKKIPYIVDFCDYAPVLENWVLTTGDFADLPIQANDFIYADPPYDVPFTKYSAKDFKWEDQVRLAEWLAVQKVPAITSNQATERIVELYEELGFQLQYLDAPRRISCKGDRTPAREILAFRNIELPPIGE